MIVINVNESWMANKIVENSNWWRIYKYVWKLKPTVLELYLWADKLLFFSRRDLNSHHRYTAAPIAQLYVQRGTYKVRNEIETKRNETKRNQRKRNETKQNEINENETKRNETKRNQRNGNEMKRNQRNRLIWRKWKEKNKRQNEIKK